MGLRINQNIAAQNAYRNLTVTEGQMSKSLEKLSSGFRINRAADDAAGLSISEGLRAQVGGTKVAIRNAQDGISVVQTAEGALSEVHSILQRMRDLAVQAGNTGSQDSNAVAAAQKEVDGLVSELDRISETTSFGSTKLLNGAFGQSQKLEGTTAAFTNRVVGAATDEFNLTFTPASGGAPQTVGVTLNQATYTSGEDFAAEVNRAMRAAITGAGGDGNEVTMSYEVNQAGTGGRFVMQGTGSATFATADGNDATNTIETLAGIANATSALAGSGGVFQVGANTNSADRITVSISNTSSTSLGVGSIDLTNATTSINDIDDAIEQVSGLRADLGAVQNRFEHTIANLSVAAENLTASESRIRDTDMAQEMVSFTRAQILTQAGTAMLAQANQAPQQVLQLLR
jgi:flagellin